jgi:hypothetical protein
MRVESAMFEWLSCDSQIFQIAPIPGSLALYT